MSYDFAWKDPQLFSPAPQPPSGGSGRYEVNPQQQLLRVEFAVPGQVWHQGRNEVNIGIQQRIPYCCQEIVLEKLELHLRHSEA